MDDGHKMVISECEKVATQSNMQQLRRHTKDLYIRASKTKIQGWMRERDTKFHPKELLATDAC